MQACVDISMHSDAIKTAKGVTLASDKKKTSCDEARSQCDRLYSVLSTVEEDCKTYRIYLGCLGMLKSTQTLCQADFHYWMMLSTTEKLITEKCSPGDTSPIEPPREIFNYPISPKSNKILKIPSLSPCLDPSHNSLSSKNHYHSCAIFSHPNLLTYSGERQTCRLRGAWPLVNNRYISVQISGSKFSQFFFQDETVSGITLVSIILKPDGKCLIDLAVPTLIYVASSQSRLATLFLNSRRDMYQTTISIKSLDLSDGHEKVEIWLGYINSRIVISRTLVAHDEYSLSVSVMLPSQVALAKPRSKQQSLVRELCSLGCPAPESIDEDTVLKNVVHHISNVLKPPIDSTEFCRHHALNGAFFDACFLMVRVINAKLANEFPAMRKSLENYVAMSIKQVQINVREFSKAISENFSVDLNSRTTFQPFRPLWKIRLLDRELSQTKSSNVLLTLPLSVVATLYSLISIVS